MGQTISSCVSVAPHPRTTLDELEAQLDTGDIVLLLGTRALEMT